MHAESQHTRRPERYVSGWYEIFFRAMKEHDRRRALTQIEGAQQAIRERLVELRDAPRENASEFQDLEGASVYLSILLQCIATESGKFLWD